MKMKMTPQNIYNNRFTYKVEPINQLLNNIESKKVDKVIFSPEMDTVVTQTKETMPLIANPSYACENERNTTTLVEQPT